MESQGLPHVVVCDTSYNSDLAKTRGAKTITENWLCFWFGQNKFGQQ